MIRHKQAKSDPFSANSLTPLHSGLKGSPLHSRLQLFNTCLERPGGEEGRGGVHGSGLNEVLSDGNYFAALKLHGSPTTHLLPACTPWLCPKWHPILFIMH